jgi:hypothetical protein
MALGINGIASAVGALAQTRQRQRMAPYGARVKITKKNIAAA